MARWIELTEVVITGIGMITPLGTGTEETWKNLLAGKNAVGGITRFDSKDLDCRIAAEVKDFNPEDFVSKKDAKRFDRVILQSIAAAKMAMEDAGLDFPIKYEQEQQQTGMVIGSGIGGLTTYELQHIIFLASGQGRVSPLLIPNFIPSMPAGITAIQGKIKGPNLALGTACATGAHAIGEAYNMLRFSKIRRRAHKRIIRMLAGATEFATTPFSIAGFSNMRALSKRNNEPERASRPFDAQRDGFVMGEGAAVLVLEDLEFAIARGAKIYALIVGYGANCDAYHFSAPDPEGKGAVRCMQLALEDALINPKKIDLINTHGTSTLLNDRIETLAIKQVFGDCASDIPINSTKSMIAHPLGAGGAIEAGVIALSIRDQIMHQTINYEFPDPDCDLDYVVEGARKGKIDYALSNSFGFGGHNAVLIFKRYP